MVTTPDKSMIEFNEPEIIVEEFKQKVIQSLNKQRERLREIADKEEKLILTKAYQDAAGLTSKAQEEAKLVLKQAEEQANRESAVILAQGRDKVEQIVRNAEQLVRREAREKTKAEVESIMRKAKEEASTVAERTLQKAQDEASNTLSEAKKQTTNLSRQIVDRAEKEALELTSKARELKERAAFELESAQRKASQAVEQALISIHQEAISQAEKEANQIISQSKLEALKEKEFIIARATADARKNVENETFQIIQKARQEAQYIIDAAKNKIACQLDESSRLMQEIQQRMRQVIGSSSANVKGFMTENISPTTLDKPSVLMPNVQKADPAPIKEPQNPSPQYAPVPTSNKSPHVVQEKIDSIFNNNEKRAYQGNLKIDIAPPVDNAQINDLEQQLLKTSDLRVIVKGGTDDGSAWIEVELQKPLPLVDILKNIPCVKDVVGAKSYIIVALRSKQLV